MGRGQPGPRACVCNQHAAQNSKAKPRACNQYAAGNCLRLRLRLQPGVLAGRKGAKEKCPGPGAGVCRRAEAEFVAWLDERGLDGEAELRAMAAGRITPARRQAMLAAGVSSESDGEDEGGGYAEGGYYEDEGVY